MKRELIDTIKIDKANLEHIAKTGKINGTLLIEIERVIIEFAAMQANGAEQSDSNCNIPLVSGSAFDYKKAFELAMKYIDESPCDPDITEKQQNAWIDLKHYIEGGD